MCGRNILTDSLDRTPGEPIDRALSGKSNWRTCENGQDGERSRDMHVRPQCCYLVFVEAPLFFFCAIFLTNFVLHSPDQHMNLRQDPHPESQQPTKESGCIRLLTSPALGESTGPTVYPKEKKSTGQPPNLARKVQIDVAPFFLL